MCGFPSEQRISPQRGGQKPQEIARGFERGVVAGGRAGNT
jgi:hypothetical protein